MEENVVKISIIVPVYNLEKEIASCIQSIQNQSHKNLEIIVVDDGSSDQSWQLIREAASHDARIVPIHQENQGVSSARFTGIHAATGRYIGFVDGDDRVLPDMFQRLLRNALEQDAEISHCGFQMVFPDGQVRYFRNTFEKRVQSSTEALRLLILGEYEPGLCNKLFRAELFEKVMQDRALVSEMNAIVENEDLLLNYALFSLAERVVYEDFCPYQYLVRIGSATRSSYTAKKGRDTIRVKEIIEEHAEDGVKAAAQIALVNTFINVYNCTTDSSDPEVTLLREEARRKLIRHWPAVSLLSKRRRLHAWMIRRLPALHRSVYRFYAAFLQKNPYGS